MMFNSGYKKEALRGLESAKGDYDEKWKLTVSDIEKLQKTREQSIVILKRIEKYINSLANRPKEYDKIIGIIRVRYQKFQSKIDELKNEGQKADVDGAKLAGAGIATGAGVAAFAPSAAMAVAMTFGTASTGTAIATLSGAAATNAALAWLGGGALAAGGAGVIGGEALLALAGPIGWAIGGVGLIGGGLLANGKNKKVAQQAEEATREIKKGTKHLSEVDVKVNTLRKETKEIMDAISSTVKTFENLNIRDFRMFDGTQIDRLGVMMNSSEALSSRIGEVVE